MSTITSMSHPDSKMSINTVILHLRSHHHVTACTDQKAELTEDCMVSVICHNKCPDSYNIEQHQHH